MKDELAHSGHTPAADDDGGGWALLSRTLEEHGYALTSQRRVIFTGLRRSFDHPTAEELYVRLRRTNPELSLATVYKNLHLLSRVGLARAVPTPDGKARFEATGEPHHHLRCIYCGDITDLADSRVEVQLPENVGETSGFLVLDAEVQIHGVCASCAPKMESAAGAPFMRGGRPPRRRR